MTSRTTTCEGGGLAQYTHIHPHPPPPTPTHTRARARARDFRTAQRRLSGGTTFLSAVLTT